MACVPYVCNLYWIQIYSWIQVSVVFDQLYDRIRHPDDELENSIAEVRELLLLGTDDCTVMWAEKVGIFVCAEITALQGNWISAFFFFFFQCGMSHLDIDSTWVRTFLFLLLSILQNHIFENASNGLSEVKCYLFRTF